MATIFQKKLYLTEEQCGFKFLYPQDAGLHRKRRKNPPHTWWQKVKGRIRSCLPLSCLLIYEGGNLYPDKIGFIFLKRGWKHSLCYESNSEEYSAGNLDATFHGVWGINLVPLRPGREGEIPSRYSTSLFSATPRSWNLNFITHLE